ncbi:MAG: hypothetical protein ABW135_04955 [Thermoleophilaceae bacterium]
MLLRDVEAEVRELHEALAEAAPVRGPDGGLPAADVVAVERAARTLKRWRHVSVWCDLHGRLVERTGEVKPAARYELEAARELARALQPLRERHRKVRRVFVLAGRPLDAPEPPFNAVARALAGMEREA